MASTTKPKSKKSMASKPKTVSKTLETTLVFEDVFKKDVPKATYKMVAKDYNDLRKKISAKFKKPLVNPGERVHIYIKGKEVAVVRFIGSGGYHEWNLLSEHITREYDPRTGKFVSVWGNLLPPGLQQDGTIKSPISGKKPSVSKTDTKSMVATLVFDPIYNDGWIKRGEKDYVKFDDFDKLRKTISKKYGNYLESTDWIRIFVGGKQIASIQMRNVNRHIWWPTGKNAEQYNPLTGKIVKG